MGIVRAVLWVVIGCGIPYSANSQPESSGLVGATRRSRMSNSGEKRHNFPKVLQTQSTIGIVFWVQYVFIQYLYTITENSETSLQFVLKVEQPKYDGDRFYVPNPLKF